MLPDRAGQAKRAAPPQAGRRRQGLKPEWGETGYRARFTKARSWPWPGDAMSRLLRIRLDRRAQRARQPSVTSGALSGCQRSLGLALIQRSGHAGIDLDQHSCGPDTPQGARLAIDGRSTGANRSTCAKQASSRSFFKIWSLDI